MAVSAKEQIVANYETALKAISVANGYARDVAVVDRFTLGSMDQYRNTIIEIKQGLDSKQTGALGIEERTLQLHTIVKVRHDPAVDGLATDTVLNDHEADIYKAALTDRTRGALAHDTRWISTDTIESDEDGTRAVLSVNMEIDYGHLLGDATAART